MSVVTLIDVRLLAGGYEVSADHTAGQLSRAKDAKDATTFGNRDRVYRSGLKSAAFSLNGYFDSDGTDAINDVHQTQYVDSAAQVATFIMPDGLEFATAYSLESIVTDLTDLEGQHGELAGFNASGVATGDNFRGTILEDGAAAISASGNGTGLALTSVGAGEIARGALHVIERTGSATVDVTIESDTVGFPSPTTRGCASSRLTIRSLPRRSGIRLPTKPLPSSRR